MIKASTLLFLHAETSLHPGSGEALGAIDLAVQRERFSGFPTIAGQGLKGPTRRAFPEDDLALHRALFGPATSEDASAHAGAAAFSDARLLLFPVRSLRGVFAWVTCPLALARLEVDLARVVRPKTDAEPERVGNPHPFPEGWQIPQPQRDAQGRSPVLGGSDAHACRIEVRPPGQQGQPETVLEQVVLEEEAFPFEAHDEIGQLATWLCDHAFPEDGYDFFKDWLKSHLLVLSDDDFAHFVQHATEVQARVALNEHKTTSDDGNLFYQENLPPETVFYAVIGAQDDLSGKLNGAGGADHLLTALKALDQTWLQVGGDESVGKGVVRLSFLHPKADEQITTSTSTGG